MTDIHTKKAAELFGVPINQVTPEMRRYVKNVNFAAAYGWVSPLKVPA